MKAIESFDKESKKVITDMLDEVIWLLSKTVHSADKLHGCLAVQQECGDVSADGRNEISRINAVAGMLRLGLAELERIKAE